MALNAVSSVVEAVFYEVKFASSSIQQLSKIGLRTIKKIAI